MLRFAIDRIAADAGAEALAVSVYDYESETAFSLRGSRSFHAASTIKVAILMALYDAIDRGTLPADGRLHVRNRFLSAADGEPFRVDAGRDANADVYARRGKALPLAELARHMIQTSSNLATNLLVDLLGPETIRDTLHRLDVRGVQMVRGVEDEKAWAAGINNTVTADGLTGLFRRVEEDALSETSTEAVREILLGQQFRSGIPAGLPGDARVAHKTGEISTVTHDAGIVYLDGRRPYVLSILTEWDPDVSTSDRRSTLATVSRLVYDSIVSSPNTDG